MEKFERQQLIVMTALRYAGCMGRLRAVENWNAHLAHLFRSLLCRLRPACRLARLADWRTLHQVLARS